MYTGYGHNFRVMWILTTVYHKNMNKVHKKLRVNSLLQNSATTYYQHQQMNYKIKGQLWDMTSLKWMRTKEQDSRSPGVQKCAVPLINNIE